MTMLRILMVVLALSVAPRLVRAQAAEVPVAADSTVEVRLRDGSVLYGRIVERSESKVVLVTSGGTRIELDMIQVASIRSVTTRGPDGRYWAPDPNASRLFFTATARPLAKGEGYLSSYFIFFPMVGYGITDRITLAAGTPIIPEALGQLWYVAPKVTVLNHESLSVAVGALGLWAPFEADLLSSVGIAYAAGTYGSRDHAVTFGAGWGYIADEGTANFSSRPVFMLGGETRTAASLKLITENWFTIDGGSLEGLSSFGVRFIGARLSTDLGIIKPIGIDGYLPMVNFVYAFGNRAR
jgi:hypothetical protein